MFKKAILAGVLSFAISPAAHAAVIGFDDASGGGPNSEYTSEGFTFTPASALNDTKCFLFKCIKEFRQGALTTVNYDATGDEEDDPFDLDFFYFTVQGLTTEINNNFTVTGHYADDPTSTIVASFQLEDLIPSSNNGATISFAKDIGGTKSGETEFENNVGYWVDLDDTWHDLIKVTWTINTAGGSRDGQARLDCVGLNESSTGAQSVCVDAPPPPPIPLPAAGWLLLGGLGGLAALRRKAYVS